MRKIIFFLCLLTLSFCYSQDSLKTKRVGPHLTIKEYVKQLKSEWFITNLLMLYDEYEQECYIDSTEVIFAIYKNWDTGETFRAIYSSKAGVSIYNLIEVETDYIHRKPTFVGFIEFLKIKTNKKGE